MAFVFKLNQLLQIALHEENEVKDRLMRKDGEIAELDKKIQEVKDFLFKEFERTLNVAS